MNLEQLQNHSNWIISCITDLPAKYEFQIEDNTFVRTIVSKQGGLIETEEGDFFPAYALQSVTRVED